MWDSAVTFWHMGHLLNQWTILVPLFVFCFFSIRQITEKEIYNETRI